MGAMSEMDIAVRNYIVIYRQGSDVLRSALKREAATEAYMWNAINDAIKEIDLKEEGN